MKKPFYKIKKSETGTIIIYSHIENCEDLIDSDSQLSDQDALLINSIVNKKKQDEKLLVRFMLKDFFGHYVQIYYDKKGKPKINEAKISISHSKGLVAVAISHIKTPSLDVQEVTSRINNVSTKVFNEKEIEFLKGKDDKIRTLYWCGKEVLYKWYGGEIQDYKNDLHLELIDEELVGYVKGIKVEMEYIFENVFCFVWA